MKKIFIYILFSFIFSNISFAKKSGCTDGDFNDSKWHGKGTLKFPDGSTYVGEWKNNKMHGIGVFTWSDGKMKKGTWNEGEYAE